MGRTTRLARLPGPIPPQISGINATKSAHYSLVKTEAHNKAGPPAGPMMPQITGSLPCIRTHCKNAHGTRDRARPLPGAMLSPINRSLPVISTTLEKPSAVPGWLHAWANAATNASTNRPSPLTNRALQKAGSEAFLTPFLRAFSVSMVPQTLSSVAPIEKSTGHIVVFNTHA